MYIHVHVVMYLYVHGINMYAPCSDTYVPFCPILSRWVGFQMCIKQSKLCKLEMLSDTDTGTYLHIPILHMHIPAHTCTYLHIHWQALE